MAPECLKIGGNKASLKLKELHDFFKVKLKVKEGKLGGTNPKNSVCDTKGQSISKCPFGVFKPSKKSTKFLPGFLP